MTRHILRLTGIVLALAAAGASAENLTYVLLPDNLGESRLNFDIKSEEVGADLVMFTIVVYSGRETLSKSGDGFLEIQDGNVTVARCKVKPEKSRIGTRFTFTVAKNHLENSDFTFRNYHLGLPSFDGYVIPLRAFGDGASRSTKDAVAPAGAPAGE